MRHLSPHTTRFIDEDTDHDKLYEVTLNTVQDRFFFIPHGRLRTHLHS